MTQKDQGNSLSRIVGSHGSFLFQFPFFALFSFVTQCVSNERRGALCVECILRSEVRETCGFHETVSYSWLQIARAIAAHPIAATYNKRGDERRNRLISAVARVAVGEYARRSFKLNEHDSRRRGNLCVIKSWLLRDVARINKFPANLQEKEKRKRAARLPRSIVRERRKIKRQQ